MKTSTILYILIFVALLVVTSYYVYYARSDNCEEMQEIPHSLLYEQEKTIVELNSLSKDLEYKNRQLEQKIKENSQIQPHEG